MDRLIEIACEEGDLASLWYCFAGKHYPTFCRLLTRAELGHFHFRLRPTCKHSLSSHHQSPNPSACELNTSNIDDAFADIFVNFKLAQATINTAADNSTTLKSEKFLEHSTGNSSSIFSGVQVKSIFVIKIVEFHFTWK
ncbi:unnamed protein product [Protopolystoma xenopodis]|uniref:Uncharacterized protein n=1 Tax=Protopolystoma xenopodis TaxID=117903 RepID=A0A448WXZ0_9PLAT|nr:unnamed protein product [Protopolystoma xenopodis]